MQRFAFYLSSCDKCCLQDGKLVFSASNAVVQSEKSMFIMRNTVGTKPVDLDKVSR